MTAGQLLLSPLRYTEKPLLWSNCKGHLLQKGDTALSYIQYSIFSLTFLIRCLGKVISIPKYVRRPKHLKSLENV